MPGRARLEVGATGRGPREPAPWRAPGRSQLGVIYRALLDCHGPQQWWPTALEDGPEARLEICLGAILTQNTAWRGAARALENLQAARATSAEAILELPVDVLAQLVRPSGHFNVKARKLQEFCQEVLQYGDIDALLDAEPEELRQRLLAIWGIGNETADAIVLYAARRATFVVDAYTYRLFERLGLAPAARRYESYRAFLLDRIGPDVALLNEWHALIVRHGQRTCRRSNPRCDECSLLSQCEYGRSQVGILASPGRATSDGGDAQGQVRPPAR